MLSPWLRLCNIRHLAGDPEWITPVNDGGSICVGLWAAKTRQKEWMRQLKAVRGAC